MADSLPIPARAGVAREPLDPTAVVPGPRPLDTAERDGHHVIAGEVLRPGRHRAPRRGRIAISGAVLSAAGAFVTLALMMNHQATTVSATARISPSAPLPDQPDAAATQQPPVSQPPTGGSASVGGGSAAGGTAQAGPARAAAPAAGTQVRTVAPAAAVRTAGATAAVGDAIADAVTAARGAAHTGPAGGPGVTGAEVTGAEVTGAGPAGTAATAHERARARNRAMAQAWHRHHDRAGRRSEQAGSPGTAEATRPADARERPAAAQQRPAGPRHARGGRRFRRF